MQDTTFKPSSAKAKLAKVETENTLKLENRLQKQLEEDVASDIYTDCKIREQEKKILKLLKSESSTLLKQGEDTGVSTPKCIYSVNLKKPFHSCQINEVANDALMPEGRNLLEKELQEQDVLSDAFQSIISSQIKNKENVHKKSNLLDVAPKHINKTIKHFKNCHENVDILKDNNISETDTNTLHELNKKVKEFSDKNSINIECTELTPRASYSSDSLIADDQSSASDYISAAYNCSPGDCVGAAHRLSKIENIFTSSDSGLENTAMESLSSHKDVILTDVSLTESTLHDITTDDRCNSHGSTSSLLGDSKTTLITTLESNDSNVSDKHKDIINSQSSKADKQRLNEEIVIMESSSLSSETGSWESVFPSKCEKVTNAESFNCAVESHTKNECSSVSKDACIFSTQKSSCFIDASSLADDEDGTSKLNCDKINTLVNDKHNFGLPAPSQPLPCSRNKTDLSPSNWSDNDDSLEQRVNKDQNIAQKDLSPTIFEMTPISEYSLCVNTNESSTLYETVFETSNTPHNSIMSIKSSSDGIYENKDNPTRDKETETNKTYSNKIGADSVSITSNNSTLNTNVSSLKKYTIKENESKSSKESQQANMNNTKSNVCHINGNGSVQEHLSFSRSFVDSPVTCRRSENTPIVSGAYVPLPETDKPKTRRVQCNTAWTVDMSSTPNYKKNAELESIEKSGHNFFIDLSSIPEPENPQNTLDTQNEKKNIFSMYIDIGESTTTHKENSSKISAVNSKRKNIIEISNTTGDIATPQTKTLKSSNDINPSNIQHTNSSNFEKFESLCDDPNISIAEILRLHKKSLSDKESKSEEKQYKTLSNTKAIHTNRKKNVKENDTIKDGHLDGLFVKLSDLDKPAQQVKKSMVSCNAPVLEERMTKSIPENNWSNRPSSSRSNDVISSFHSENAQSLNRLFPNLSDEFSKSMPGAISMRTRSPLRLGTTSSTGDLYDQTSDTSEMSSMQNSFYRAVESSMTEDTSQASSIISNCQSRLGQDLLRMFLEEIAPDVIVEVSGRRIKAHKCILSSRCQYFAGVLSGGWVESAGNVISLPPFSFNVVHFALCHIYSGVYSIPDTVNIVELATLADMLGLEGLKEAIMHTLKAKYCHYFHLPCPICIAGVLECFPLSAVYGLDDLYRKCVKWISFHFSIVWATKAFATLPTDLIEKCFQQAVRNLSSMNSIDVACGCGFLVDSLGNAHWTEIVICLSKRLLHAVATHSAPKILSVLKQLETLPTDLPSVAVQEVKKCITMAIEISPLDECCRAYAYVSQVVKAICNRVPKPVLIRNGNTKMFENQDNILHQYGVGWLATFESAIVRAAPRGSNSKAYLDLPADVRGRLRELADMMYGGSLPDSVPKGTSLSKKKAHGIQQPADCNNENDVAEVDLELEEMRSYFQPVYFDPLEDTYIADEPPAYVQPSKTIQELKDAFLKSMEKLGKTTRNSPPVVKKTKAQEERAKYNMVKANQVLTHPRIANTIEPGIAKSRNKVIKEYHKTDNENKKHTAKIKMISSSESSPNSSPLHSRNIKTKRTKSKQLNENKQQALSQHSLASSPRPRIAEPSIQPLSESQTSNKYATYTKTKHTAAGHIDVTKSGRQPTHSSEINGAIPKTKIPVRTNQPLKSYQTETKVNNGSPVKNPADISAPMSSNAGKTAFSMQPRHKIPARNNTRSLMNATKSSSAKMVPKVVKDSYRVKIPPKNTTATTQYARRPQRRPQIVPVIPIMERSVIIWMLLPVRVGNIFTYIFYYYVTDTQF
ncbi:hypothetical protein ACJJTC_001012 [Scirpophaga incertulas]